MEIVALVVVFLASLLGQPSFWYCVVALLCAKIISNGIRRGLRAHAVVMRRTRGVDEEDDSDYELPETRDFIETHFDEKAFDRANRRAD